MNQNKEIISIMATTEQGVIGCNNILPWNYPEEMEHFRSTTKGHIVVMGKGTYDTPPESLSINRDFIVFSHDPNLTSNYAKIVNSLDEFLQYIQSLETTKKIFMIGRASIAHLF
ncbi:MAG: dihydrofolate reductase [Candidatus Rickettsia vulgarisii]